MTNQISRKTTIFFLILAIGFMPALSYAKSDKEKKNRSKSDNRNERVEINDDRDNDRDDDDNDKNKRKGRNEERKDSRKELCRIAFGHLFAPGYIKNWGSDERDFFWNCFVPFGISKKFNGTASSTPDILAPVISNLLAKPNTVKATITWNTNEKSDSAVFWSNSANVNVNSSSTATVTKIEKVKEHKLVIENLTASTTYYFVIRSKDPSGNTSTSTESSFTTKSVSSDSIAPIISSVTLLVGTSTANIGWHTNENATSRVYYGTSSGLDINASTTSFTENSTLKQSHSVLLSNLSTSTLYYFVAESKDANGNKTVTPVFSATTNN